MPLHMQVYALLKRRKLNGGFCRNSKYRIWLVGFIVFYVHSKQLRSCWDGQLTLPHFSWAGLDLLCG